MSKLVLSSDIVCLKNYKELNGELVNILLLTYQISNILNIKDEINDIMEVIFIIIISKE